MQQSPSSNQITSNGRLTTNEFLQINGQASVGGGCSPNGLQGRTSAGQLLSCVNGVWTNTTSLKRMVFMISGETKNYGDICQKYLDNNGYTALGWVASGSDACTEDEEYCTIDNVRCFALKTQ
ncbi:shufflon system plasmid conjugative transfer pilus tip adhesin PilV [Klebsiella michiganensis]|uniref:shufflon system plasmid conjugative transfer pilus tip adhesin PilV n=1 Tax=Klebsiella michiganensis TaxID=1134687 RepID=UPI00374F0E64